jgi:hypothetical protein
LATADLGVVEYTARVVAFLSGVGLVAPHDWNGAAVSTWLRESAVAAGQNSPVADSADGAALVAQLVAAKRWIPRAGLTIANVRPGMIAARRAAAGSPIVLVGVVSAINVGTGLLTTIQGSAGERRDRVATRGMLLSDALFLGVGGV